MQTPTRTTIHPTVALFLKLTAAIAIALVLIWIASTLIMIAFVAAIIAALAVGGILLYKMIRRRSNFPTLR
jgi:hypothetical protein